MARTINIDPSKVDRGTVEAIIMQEMEENSPFEVEPSNMGEPGSTTFRASMDVVNVMEVGGQIQVKVDADTKTEDAIVTALRSQESSRSRDSRDMIDDSGGNSDVVGVPNSQQTTTQNMAGEVAAEMTLMEDGTLEVQYPDGSTDTIDTKAGFFLTGDRIGEMLVGLSFYEDNFDASNDEIREAIDGIRANLREESESSDMV